MICSDIAARKRSTVRRNFHPIWIIMEQTLLKWAPVNFILLTVCIFTALVWQMITHECMLLLLICNFGECMSMLVYIVLDRNHFIQMRYWDYRADSRFAPSQWETALFCNAVSHWLGTSLESALKWEGRIHTHKPGEDRTCFCDASAILFCVVERHTFVTDWDSGQIMFKIQQCSITLAASNNTCDWMGWGGTRAWKELLSQFSLLINFALFSECWKHWQTVKWKA